MKQAIFALVFLIMLIVVFTTVEKPIVIRYDCSIAEIHPDYPVAVKEECRKLRSTEKNI